MSRRHPRRRRRPMGSPPLPAHWPTGKGRASFCRGLERMFKGCGHEGAECRDQAHDRALAASCPWAVRLVNRRPYSGKLWRD